MPIHAESNERDFLATPVECGVGVALFLTATVDGSRHVGKQMRRSEAHEADTVAELMSYQDHLMLGQVKGVCRVVVALDELYKTEGFSQLIHVTLRPVELNPGDTRGHDLMADAAHQPFESASTPFVKRSVLARAEILQVGLDLRSTRHWRLLDCTDHGAALFHIEDAAALRVTVSGVGTRLQQALSL